MRHHQILLESQALTEDFLASQDCVLIVTDNDRYDWKQITRLTKLLVDTRNATAGLTSGACRIVKA
jgi:UDP-N-acetyl-D-glucosamine dehydrogenase